MCGMELIESSVRISVINSILFSSFKGHKVIIVYYSLACALGYWFDVSLVSHFDDLCFGPLMSKAVANSSARGCGLPPLLSHISHKP